MLSQGKSRRIAYLAALIAIGCAIWIIEELIPHPLPWIKPGLANIATLLALYLMRPSDALIVAVSRVLLGALILGRFGSAGFFISLSGAVLSALAMFAVRKSGLPFSIYGVSLFGALFHGLAQLLVAGILVYNLHAVVYLTPWVLLPSIATGLLVAHFARMIIARIRPKLDID
ncbi:MAG TPA: Gx transporter family protein [candidate division Zixibacteria bacterium]|nr:Gx transporter family protein [candidate division Zixibacteria bacterium]